MRQKPPEVAIPRDSAAAEAEVRAFNERYPVGTKGRLHKDSGDIIETEIRHEAYVSNSGHPVAFFAGVSGYYIIDRFTATFE